MIKLNELLSFPDNIKSWYKDKYKDKIIRYYTNSLKDYFDNVTKLPIRENGLIILIETPLRVYKKIDNIQYELYSPERFYLGLIFDFNNNEEYEVLINSTIEQKSGESKEYKTIEIVYNHFFHYLINVSDLPLSPKKQEGYISIEELLKKSKFYNKS